MGRMIAMPLPRLGETMEEGRIGLRLKQPGEAFRRGETLLEVESDKTTVEVPALQDGVLIEWLVETDQMVPVESAIARIEIEGEAAAEAKTFVPAKAEAVVAVGPGFRRGDDEGAHTSRPRASTAARAAARRLGIDLSRLTGSGRGGRITRADLSVERKPARAAHHVADIFVREWPAEGPARGTAVLLHGLFSDSQSFRTLGRMLAAKGLNAIALDLPGHGESRSPAKTLDAVTAAVAEALPAGPLHLAGHSFGALIAARLASRAASLTLLAPAGCGEEINADFIAAMLGGHVDHALTYLGDAKLPAEAVAQLADHLSTANRQLAAIAGGVQSEGRQTVTVLPQIAALTIPVTAVFQRDDQVIPAHHALNLPPNVAVRFLPGGGHLPHWREPGLIAAMISAAS